MNKNASSKKDCTQPLRPSSLSPLKIGLLGGSFNPAHDGHREISLLALKHLQLEAIWWLVTPGNPLKSKDQYKPLAERLTTAKSVARHNQIHISDFESKHNFQYTADTLSSLRELNPGVRFVWLMGADSMASFHRWKDWRGIAGQVPIAVFNRPSYGDAFAESDAAIALAEHQIQLDQAHLLATMDPPVWVYIPHSNNSVSSTDIRNAQT